MHLRTNNVVNTGMAGDKCDIDGIFLKENDIPGAKLVREPSECSVEELKRWLECHGQKKSGKKHELVERKSRSKGGRRTLVQCKIKYKQTE